MRFSASAGNEAGENVKGIYWDVVEEKCPGRIL
jgi:hypothetical protein